MNFKTVTFGIGAVLLFGTLMFAISKIPAQAPVGNSNTSGTNTPTQTGGESSLGIAGIDRGFSVLGVTVIPREVLEDSRCPINAVCIQAGTVRVRASLESGLGKADQVFVLGEPITTEAEVITLASVQPQPIAGEARAPKDYIFTFRVDKR